MSQPELDALRSEIRAGFQSVNERLDEIDNRLGVGFHDAQHGIHGLMLKLLAVAEVNEIRSNMKSPPDLKHFPVWSLR